MFEVKPWDTETDLKELFAKICKVRESRFASCFCSFSSAAVVLLVVLCFLCGRRSYVC